MRRWLSPDVSKFARPCQLRRLSSVSFGPRDVESVSVACGSSGNVRLDLHNLSKVSTSAPLVVYLPPHGVLPGHAPVTVPRFLQKHPTVVINYRWAGQHRREEPTPSSVGLQEDELADDDLITTTPLHWPTPIHDTLQGYSWVTANLVPSTFTRRDVYVYGTYLGGSLAASMALTEAHPHLRMGVRGFIAFNGIYNWTSFLPDHPINKLPKQKSLNVLEEILDHSTDPGFAQFKHDASELFGRPSNLFDPFASACLFFQTPGLAVPPGFNSSADPLKSLLTSSIALSAGDLETLSTFKQPRRSALNFPPRKSTLKIPETLLLHTAPPPPSPALRKAMGRKKDVARNNFRTQAEELGLLMRKSIDKLELKDRMKWDDDFDGWDEEAQRRVKVYDVGQGGASLDLGDTGEHLAEEWLTQRMAKRM